MCFLFKKSFSERFRNGFGNIIGNFCSARFENTFPKISRIIHFEEPHAPTLRHMITDLSRTTSGPSQNYSRRQSLGASSTSLKQHAAEQARIKKRNSTRYEKASSMVHEPEMTTEQLNIPLTRVVMPNARSLIWFFSLFVLFSWLFWCVIWYVRVNKSNYFWQSF